MANQVVRAAGYQFWLVLLCHWAPVAPDVHTGPDRESQPDSECGEPETSTPGFSSEVVVAKGAGVDQDDHDDRDDRAETQLYATMGRGHVS